MDISIITDLETERDQLKLELAAAKAELAKLRQYVKENEYGFGDTYTQHIKSERDEAVKVVAILNSAIDSLSYTELNNDQKQRMVKAAQTEARAFLARMEVKPW